MTDPQQCHIGRLYLILERLKAAGTSKPISTWIREELGDETAPDAAVSRWLSEFHLLIQEASREVRNLPAFDQEFMLDWLVGVQDAAETMFLSPGSQLQGPISHLDRVTMYALRREARDVALHDPQPYIEQEAADDLLALVRRTIVEVLRADDLPGPLRMELLARLREVELMLQTVRVVGVEGVQRAAESLIGSYVRAPQPSKGKIATWVGGILAAITAGSKGLKELEAGSQSAQNLLELLQ